MNIKRHSKSKPIRKTKNHMSKKPQGNPSIPESAKDVRKLSPNPFSNRQTEFKGVLSIILKTLFKDCVNHVDRTIHINRILHMYQHQGAEYTVRYLKACHEAVDNFSLGLKQDLKFPKISIGLDNDG